MSAFKMGSLDHIHLMVPDRYEAARWYAENLGFEIVEAYEEWAQVEGGPLHVSADGGRSSSPQAPRAATATPRRPGARRGPTPRQRASRRARRAPPPQASWRCPRARRRDRGRPCARQLRAP